MLRTFRIAVLDTETTGLYATSDRVVEIAVKLLEIDATARLVAALDAYHSLHDPGIRMPREAQAVHGITDAMVKGHRIDGQRVTDMLAQADLVIAHNSGFDKGFVRQVAPTCDAMLWGCSCRGIPWKKLYPAMWSTSLPNLANALRLPRGVAHRAEGDVETTVNLLLHRDPTGQPHLSHLLARKLTARWTAARAMG